MAVLITAVISLSVGTIFGYVLCAVLTMNDRTK